MRIWLGVLCVVVLLAAVAAPVAGAAPHQAGQSPPQSERVRSGVSHFDRAFYDLTPHKREAEAARELDLAVADFERELVAHPASIEAHRYLARIHSARKNYQEAARHYDRLSELQPLDVDACVLAALAYVEAGKVDEARARLVTAQARTADPFTLARLAEYLGRLDALPR